MRFPINRRGKDPVKLSLLEENFPFQATPDFPSCHASTLAELPDGNIICAWYAGAYEGSPDSAILSTKYIKGEKRWTSPKVIADTPGLPEGNPVLFLDLKNTLWLFFVTMFGRGWETCKVKYQRSFDGGESWEEPIVLKEELGWMTRNKPLIISKGDIILPMYDERDWTSFFLISEDEGMNWKPTPKLSAPIGLIQPALVEQEGDLIAFMRCGGSGGNIWRTVSKDGGRNWTPPHPTSLPNPNSGIDAIEIAGGVLLAFNNSPRWRTPLSLAYSKDKGENWEVLLDVEKEEGEFSYPCLLKGRDGLLHLTYTYKRIAIKHCIFQYFPL